MIKLVQISNKNDNFALSRIYVNPSHIIYMTEDKTMKENLVTNKINLDLDPNIDFTKIKLNDKGIYSEIIVIGTPELIESKMVSVKTKHILRG